MLGTLKMSRCRELSCESFVLYMLYTWMAAYHSFLFASFADFLTFLSFFFFKLGVSFCILPVY
jgi:hypothetical protein